MEKKEATLSIILDVSLDGEGGGRHEFTQKSVIIGSGPSANLRIAHPSVSSIHAILKAGEDEASALLSDLGSEEGTQVNEAEIRREATVKRGDQIRVGQVEIFVIGVGSDAVETKTERPPQRPAVREVPEEKPAAAEAKPAATPPRPPPRREEKKPAAVPETKPGTQVVRRREIPRDGETGGKSGEVFFRRELSPMERPRDGLKLLEVKAMWGRVVLDARQFAAGEMVTVGDAPTSSFRLSADRTPGEVFTLVSPGGPHGYVVQVASGMEIDVLRDGKPQPVDGLPSQGAVRTYALGLSDRVRVSMGQLAFIIQYVSPVQPLKSPLAYRFDDRVVRWFALVLIVAVGMWLAIEATPKAEAEVSDYLKNPARFAQLIMPTQREDKKKSFEEIKKKQEEKKLMDDSDKWKKVTAKEKANTKDIPREVKKEIDRKVATNAGILGLLAKKGGGSGDNASSVFGGSALTNIDQALASMNSTGMGDSSGFGGMGTRGGGPGGGGGGLGLGGLGTAGYGRGAGAGYGSVALGHRGRSDIQVVHQNTKVIGGLSQEVVGQYIKRYWAQIKFCYERELTKNPNLYGKVTITFTIGGNGRISEAQVMQTTMNNANVEECILRVIRRIIFPQPKGGGQVIVTYPFLFQLAGG